MKSTTILLVFLILPIQLLFSQDVKFGKVSKQELEEKFYPLDSSANATVLYKKRRTYYNYNQQTGWVLTTKIHERIKIYNKEGYNWATKKISLYTDGDDESVSIKAYTFNLTDNKIEKIKLKKAEIFKENINKYWNRKKFTMPNLTEGCIVEWEYTIRSPYFWRIDDVVFQYKIPVKYADTEVIMPEFFVFKNQIQGYLPINLEKNRKSSSLVLNSKSRSGGNITQTSFRQDKIDYMSDITSCIIRDVPALKEEPYVNNINNYKSLLKFEITAYKPKYSTHKYYNTTWEDVTKTIYKSSNFGDQLEKSSHFKDDLETLVDKTAPLKEKLSKVFQFVKTKIKWNNYTSKYTRDGVKKAYKEGVGNVAEINLTLVAMLREIGVDANPILVSTRSNGIPLFPTSEGFNYVIACVEVPNGIILLDATEKYSLPNVLPRRALNWQGRIVRKNKSSTSINLFPKKHSKEAVFLNIELDEEGYAKGSQRNTHTNLEGLQLRSKYNSYSDDELISKFEKDNNDIEIDEFKVTNKNEIAKPLIYQFSFETDNQVEIIGDKIYFSPLLHLTEEENIFKLEVRKYPVDFGTPWEEKYSITVTLPEGYTVETKPENVAYALPENLGSFKFVTALNGNKLQILSNTKINVPIIGANNYTVLKEFYKNMIDKQLEKVVLTKKSI